MLRLRINNARSEAWITEVDGLRLWLATSEDRKPAASGYRGVKLYKKTGRFWVGINRTTASYLGVCSSAVEGAVMYATRRLQDERLTPADVDATGRLLDEGSSRRDTAIEAVKAAERAERLAREAGQTEVVSVVDGLRLHLSASSCTGYKGVTNAGRKKMQEGFPFSVQFKRNGVRMGAAPPMHLSARALTRTPTSHA